MQGFFFFSRKFGHHLKKLMMLIPPSRVLLQTSKKLTAAQKSLSKVDKKGMKSLSSFFGAGTKKTKKS